MENTKTFDKFFDLEIFPRLSPSPPLKKKSRDFGTPSSREFLKEKNSNKILLRIFTEKNFLKIE